MTDRPHYNPNQPRVPKGQEHGGEWTRDGGEGIRADAEPAPGDPQPTLANLGAESGRGPMMAHVPVVAAAAVAAAIRTAAQRFAAGLALREAVRNSPFGDPRASPGDGSPNSRTEVPRGIAAEQAVLERVELFNALSARNNDKQVAVLEFKAGKFERASDLTVTRVGVLSREEAQQFCRHLPTVQKQLDEAVEFVRKYNPGLQNSNPAVFGTLVHAKAALNIKALGETDLDAEVYWLEGEPGKGGLGSVRSDAQETPAKPDLFCIIDHKTGRAGLSPKRMLVLAAKASELGRENIIVMETRPFEGPPLKGP